jgi:hypothetical protein
LGGGGAFSVEHELARMQGELTALLSCVNRRIRCEYEICVLFILFLLQVQPEPAAADCAAADGKDFRVAAHAGGEGGCPLLVHGGCVGDDCDGICDCDA